MVDLVHVSTRQSQPLFVNMTNHIQQLVKMVIRLRNLPTPLLSNAIRVILPGIDSGIDVINQQLTQLAGSLHHPPHFDDILNVAEADKTLAKHKQLLSGLYLLDAGPTSRTTPEALGELIRTLFSGFVAEPLPMNRWIRQALATVLEKNRKASVPDEVWQSRIEQYLIHRYLVFFPEEQRLINLPMILSLGHRYLPLPPLLQQVLTCDPLTFLYTILTWNYVAPAAPPSRDVAIWNQSRFDEWHNRAPESFLAGSTAHTLNTPAQCRPWAELPPQHSYSFFRQFADNEVPRCLSNQTLRHLPYDTEVNTFTGQDSRGIMHVIHQVQVGSAALRIRDISTIETSQLLHLTPSDAIGDGVSQVVTTPVTAKSLVLRHSADTPVSRLANAAVGAWQSVGSMLEFNFPPRVQGEELPLVRVRHHGQIFVSPRPEPVLNQGVPLVDDFIDRMQRDWKLTPSATNRKVTLLFRYQDGVPGEKRLPLKTILTTFRENEYAVIYPEKWYRHYPEAIRQFEAYRGYNRTTADPLFVRLQEADFQRLKRRDLWPGRWEVHAMDFILALSKTFKFDEKVMPEVLFIDGETYQPMTLVKVITTLPDIIQIIKWPQAIPVAATRLLEQFRKTTSPVLRKNLLLEIALNDHAVQQGFPSYSLNEMIDELQPLTLSDSLADLDMRAMAPAWVDEQINEHYDAFEQSSGLAIPQALRLNSASKVMARVYYRSGADGSETMVKSQLISLENLAYNEIQTQFGINHRIEVDIPPALKKAWLPEDPWYRPTFPVTDAIYLKMSGNVDRCQKSGTCYAVVTEMQRRLVHYRIARYLNILNDRDPQSGSDHIERKQLTELLQCTASRPTIQLVKFDGQLLTTCFAIRGAGRWLLFSTEYDGVITLQEDRQTFLTAEEQAVIYQALPLKYTMQFANDKGRLNITLATGTDWQGRLGLYEFVAPATTAVHNHLADMIFEQNTQDIEALFHSSPEIWSAFARSFPPNTFTGMTALLDQFALKPLSSIARSLTAISELVSNAAEMGVAYPLAKMTMAKNPPLPLDMLAGTGFDFTDLATRAPDLLPTIRNLVNRTHALKRFITDMLAKKQTAKILSALAHGKLQAVLPATQLRIPFANPMLNIRYSSYNQHNHLREDILPQILADGRRYAREVLKSALKTLAASNKRSLIRRLLHLFFARQDDVFIQQFTKQLRKMRRDLNRFNVRKHIHLNTEEETLMAVDLVNYRRFVKNYAALENGETNVARFSDTVCTLNSDQLLHELNTCGGSVVACAAMTLIAIFTQGVAHTLNYAQAAEVKNHKGVRDFVALCNLNDTNYILPTRFRGPDARFLAENRPAYGQEITTGSRNTDSHRWVIYFLAAIRESSLAEEGISKLESARLAPPKP